MGSKMGKIKIRIWNRLYRNAPFAPCYWCNRPQRLKTATVDHLLARSRGGTNREDNLVLACVKCNTSRGDGLPQPPHCKARPSKPYVPVKIKSPAQREADRIARLAAIAKAESLGLQVWKIDGVCFVGTPFKSVLASGPTFDEAFALVEKEFA